ncbi:MAG: alpha/beta hydrolase [Planctomycetia bacterium]|nr:alpha/beta hydrolase [Planctomycetia bacterium]
MPTVTESISIITNMLTSKRGLSDCLVLGLVFGLLGAARGEHPASFEPSAHDVAIDDDVEYRTADGERGEQVALRLDVYARRDDQAMDRPVILLLHGGSFLPAFDKRQPHLVGLAKEFARRGWVVVAPDYRTRDQPLDDPMGTLRDAVDDCRAAFEWVRKNAATRKVDPDRIAVVGSSAGGMVGASLVGLENTTARRCGGAGVFASINLWGSPVSAFRLCNFDADYPPTLIIHGTADAVVPFANAEAFVTDLQKAGVDAELLALADAPHTPVAHAEEIVAHVQEFLTKRLPP